MSFSSDIKENLSKINDFDRDLLRAEFLGYFLSGNMVKKDDFFVFVTENEFNIEHFYKILFALKINYEPDIKGKLYMAEMKVKDVEEIVAGAEELQGDLRRSIIKGAFLGAGSVNNPEKKYHLELLFESEKKSEFLKDLCEEYGIFFKKIKVNEKYQLYLKEGEEISKFLALIGASAAVLQFEDVRVMKDMKNSVNRRVNCETANLNKTVEAALRQMDDIQFIKSVGNFDKLPKKMQEIAKLRMDNPDLSLQDLGKLMEPKLSKSAVNRAFRKIHELAENMRDTGSWKGE